MVTLDNNNLSMEDICYACGRKQKVNEPYIIHELSDYHISFCSEKCETIYIRLSKQFNKKLNEFAKCEVKDE